MRHARSLLSFVVVSALVLPSPAHAEDNPAATGKIPLSWSPKGKFRITSVLIQKVEGNRNPTSMTNRIECECDAKDELKEMRLRLLSVDAEGIYKGNRTVFHLKRGKEPDLEAVDPKDQKEIRQMADLVNADLSASLTATGELSVVIEGTGERKTPGAALGLLLPRLPDGPMAVGETWSFQECLPLPGPDLEATLTCRLERVTDTEAHVSITVAPEGKGVLVYSRTEGLVKTYSLTTRKPGRNDEVMTANQTMTVVPVR